MVSKADTDLCAGDHYGTPGKTLSHIDTMKTLNSEPRITFNWRIELRPEWGNQNWTMPGTSAAPVLSALPVTERDKDSAFDLAMAMAELRSVAAERDNFAEALQRNCVQYMEKQQALIAERDRLKKAHGIAISAWDTARQSLRAAEADVAETESVNSDLRTVNARLVADLAAAVQRADTAEAILRAKA